MAQVGAPSRHSGFSRRPLTPWPGRLDAETADTGHAHRCGVGPVMGTVSDPCPEREIAAAHLGTERRRLFLIGALLSLSAPLLPYLTGTWEAAWYALAAVPLALP